MLVGWPFGGRTAGVDEARRDRVPLGVGQGDGRSTSGTVAPRARPPSPRASTLAMPMPSAGYPRGITSSAACRSDSRQRLRLPVGGWSRTQQAVDGRRLADQPTSSLRISATCCVFPVDGRPDDLPIGWVTPAGEPARPVRARAGLGARRRARHPPTLRGQRGHRRLGTGCLRRGPAPRGRLLDWRGPHPALGFGRLRRTRPRGSPRHPARQLGLVQTGVCDSCRSPTGTSPCWLYVIEGPDGLVVLTRLRVEPTASLDAGGGVDRRRDRLPRHVVAARARTTADPAHRRIGG